MHVLLYYILTIPSIYLDIAFPYVLNLIFIFDVFYFFTFHTFPYLYILNKKVLAKTHCLTWDTKGSLKMS